MPNQLSALASNHTRRRVIRRFSVALTGNYTNGTGEVLDFTNILNPRNLPNISPSFFSALPSASDFSVSRGPAGYTAEVIATGGAQLNNAFALKLFSAPATELASGAYGAAILADAVTIELTASGWGG